LDEEKSKHASMAQENGFGPAYFAQNAKPGKRCITAVNLIENVINLI
jgi:hypothetical protein